MDESADKNRKDHLSSQGKADPAADMDEFLDDPADEYDDSSWDEEDGGGGSDESGFSEPPAKKKKSFLSFNVIVIGIAIVFGGGFVLMQMAKRGSSVQSADVVAPVSRLQMSGMTDNPVFKDVRKEQGSALPLASRQTPPLPLPKESLSSPETALGLPPVGTLADVGDLPKSASQGPSDVLTPLPSGVPAEPHDPLAAFRKKKPDSSSSVDTPVSGETEGSALLDLSARPRDLSAGRGVPAVPVETVSSVGLSEPVSVEPPVKASVDGSGAPALGEKQVVLPLRSSGEIDGMRKAVSDMEARLAGIESRVTGLSKKSEKIEARAPASVSDDPEIVALKETVARLEKALSEVSRKAEQSVSVVREKETVSSAKRTSPSKERTKKLVARSGQSAKSSSLGAPDRRTPTPQWEIRAIQPGVAWVAPAGGDDMQTIGVGDSLPGLGVIRRISVVDGVWTVEGTGGRLRQ